MAKGAKQAWGIDVGNCTLKALKLGVTGEGVEILDFAVIEHETVLTQSEVDPERRREMIIEALTRFLEEHDIRKTPVYVSVSGQSSFARFIKLPPVEAKRIPELVRFEAIQQIPFNIDDVEWDWQKFQSEDTPEVEVGIFAIKKELVEKALEPFSQVGCPISGVQMAPIALYNFLRYDQKSIQKNVGKEAVIALDIGAENTDLVISDGRRVWQRSIPIGGNHFTEAIQKGFKLSFAKAEGIKRTANTSKYGRQIFQAMRSVFADLAAEVQRSLGFYSSSNRTVQFKEALALGNAMKLPGLVKFLQQSLSLPVKRLDSFELLKLGSDVSAAKFAESLPSMAVAYGLALQGLGLATIESDLLPKTIARQSQWRSKRILFAASAGTILLSALLYLGQAYSQKANIQSAETKSGLSKISSVKAEVDKKAGELNQYKADIASVEQKIQQFSQYYQDRNTVSLLLRAIRNCLPNEQNNPNPLQQKVYQGYQTGNRKLMLEVPRNQREQIFLTDVKIYYVRDLAPDVSALAQMGGDGTGLSPTQSSFSAGMPGGEGDFGREGRSMGREGGGMGMGMPGGMGIGMGGPGAAGPGQAPSVESGFVVVLEGFTPHKNNLAFLFPPNVGLDRSKWGFFNHLRYLGKTDEEIVAEQKKIKESRAAASQPGEGGPGLGGPGPGLGAGPGPSFGNPFQPKPGPAEGSPSAPASAPQPELLDSPQTQEQATANEGAKWMPFETFIDPAKPEEYSFYTRDGNWIGSASSSNMMELSQPKGLGIPKPLELQRPGMPTMGGWGAMGMEGGRREGGGLSAGSSFSNVELVDPFTLETISIVPELDNAGLPKLDSNGAPILLKNDYWFRIKFKIKVKSEPETKT